MKLSKVQQNVLDKMRDGWELGMSHSFGVNCWLQKDGIGKGGESEDIRYSTLSVLFQKKLIKQRGRTGLTMVFELT